MTHSNRKIPNRLATLLHPLTTTCSIALPVAVSVLSCSSPLDTARSSNANESAAWGNAEFALTAELDGVRYALRDAEFSLSGPEEVLLRSNDYPNDVTLVQEVQSGQYTLELLPGYRLVTLSDEGEQDVEAILETPNPQTLLVAADQTTAVHMLFRVAQQPVAFGRGSVAVALSIEPEDPGGIFFSEFMVNPAALPDTDGEWIELMNSTSADFDLTGCTIARDDSSFTVAESLVVPAGGFVSLSNGTSPGFTPNLQYSGVSLPNTAIFSLSLVCNGLELDAVQVDPGSWPLSAGMSTSLDPSHANTNQNDEGSAWCLASTSYGTDFGTPGSENDVCQQ